MRIGLFVGGMLVAEYDYEEYSKALDDAKYAFDETDVPHEIKFI